jgi:hypothetical protein
MDGLKLLVGKEKICGYIGVGKSSFHKLVKEGLPAVFDNGRWLSYTDLIDKYFIKKIEAGTRTRRKK